MDFIKQDKPLVKKKNLRNKWLKKVYTIILINVKKKELVDLRRIVQFLKRIIKNLEKDLSNG